MPWFIGIDRKEIDWFPTIDEDKCVKCGMCMNCGKGVFSWNLRITYNRSGRNDVIEFNKTLNPSDVWYISDDIADEFAGGEPILTMQPTDYDCSHVFRFSIRGLNPNEIDIQTYIFNNDDNRWYCKWVARHEGGEQSVQ